MVATAPTLLQCPQGEFDLQRYPRRKPESLQAWSSADLLLLAAHQPSAGPTLLVNDDQGALSVALQAEALWTDSALSVQAVRDNCQRNAQNCPAVIWSTQAPGRHYQQVLLRIPKQLAYLEYQLAHLAHCLMEGATLHLAGMDKHLSQHTAQLIERYFGEVERHRGVKKARLFTARQLTQKPFPTQDFSSQYYCPPLAAQLCALPNVFSREKLDIGTRFLLENLHRLRPAKQVADLACGNGILGIAAVRHGLANTLTCADESAMALSSAKRNCDAILGVSETVRFHHGDGLKGLDPGFDLILCNPPFHLSHTVDEFAGRRLFKQCADALNPEGELVLVANSHLEYEAPLRQCFGAVEQVARNNKFIVWRALQGC